MVGVALSARNRLRGTVQSVETDGQMGEVAVELDGNHSDEEVDAMYHAWLKSVTLQVALRSYLSVKDGDW